MSKRPMFGRVFSMDEDFSDTRGREPRRSVRICVAGAHISANLRSSASFAGTPVFGRLSVIASVPAPCGGSCKEHSFDLKDEIVRSADAYDYDPDGLAGQKAWEHFVESVRMRGYKPQTHGRTYAYTLGDDGDSATQLICCGHYHVIGSCAEFGSGFSYAFSGACNRSCRSDSFELPFAIADRIRRWKREQR